MAKKSRRRAGEPSRSVNAPDSDVEDAEVGDAQEPLDDQQEAGLENTDGHEALDNNQEAHANGNSSVGIASWADPIEGASIFPTIRNRVPTATEWEHVKAYVISNEEDVLLHEERCRVCYKPLKTDTLQGIRHYQEHNKKLLCPYCDQDWTGQNSKAQRQHLQEYHKDNLHSLEPEICPYSGCTVDLADRAAFPSLVEVTRHMREHIHYSDRDYFCQHPGCHANTGHMSDQMRREHEGMHEQSPPAASSTQTKSKNGGKHTQGTQTAASADLDRQNSANANQPTAGPLGAGVDNPIQTEQANALYVQNQPNEGQRVYCTICWTAQGHKSAGAQEKHARGCKTRVEDFIATSQNDAKRERDNRKKGKTKIPEKGFAEVSNSSTGQNAVAAGFIAKVRQTPATVLAQDPPLGPPGKTSKDQRTKKPESAAAAEEPLPGEGPQSRRTRSKGTKQAKPAATIGVTIGVTELAEEPPIQETRRKRAKQARPAAAVGATEPAEEPPAQETQSRRTKQARPAATAEGRQSNKAPPAPKTRNKRVKESAPAAAADVAASAQQPPSQRGRRGRRTSSIAPAEAAETAEGSNSTTTEHAEESPRAQRARNRAAPDPAAEEGPAPSKPKLRITHNAAHPGRT